MEKEVRVIDGRLHEQGDDGLFHRMSLGMDDARMKGDYPVYRMEDGKPVRVEAGTLQEGNGFTLYAGDTTLTSSMPDKGRAAMAYNVFCKMADNGVMLGTNGHEQPLDKDMLHVVNDNGRSFKPELDEEWFGTEEQNNAARKIVLDIIMEEMREDGEECDRDEEKDFMDQYTVSYRGTDTATVYFAPNSWDIDKARDVYSILTNDVSPSVTLFMDTEYDGRVMLTSGEDCLNVTNLEGNVYDPETDFEYDFEDAVAKISMEQNDQSL